MIEQIVSLSGGRTSGFMARRLLDKYPRRKFRFLFANTGKERDETLDFLHEMEQRWGIDLTWLEYTREPAASLKCPYKHPKAIKNFEDASAKGQDVNWFKIVNYKTACRRFEKISPFDVLLKAYNSGGHKAGLPNVRARYCSSYLKSRTMICYLFSQGIYNFVNNIGIRYDERDRTLNLLAKATAEVSYVFPLVEDKVSVREVHDFWKKSPFDLRLESYEGNCGFCFLKAKRKLIRLMKEQPKEAKWWIAKEREFPERGNGQFWRIDASYEELQKMASRPSFGILDKQPAMDEEPACSCADGGFIVDEE